MPNNAHIPDGWRITTLSELCDDITSGATPESGSPRYYTHTGGHPFAKIEDLTNVIGHVLHDCGLRITDVALRETAAKLYPIGTILVSMYGTIGLTKVCGQPLSANQALCALLPPFKCDPSFLLHHLNFIRSDWKKYSGQTTQPNINGSVVRAHQVLMPPMDEQGAIREVLDTLDTTIRQTEAIIAKLKQVKQGLLHDLLTRGIDANGELRPPQSEAPQLYKASPLGWIPVEWVVKPLGEVADLQVGFAFKSEWFQDAGCVRLLRGDNVGYGAPDWSSAKFLDPDAAERFEEYALNDGDIVVGMDRTFTKSGSKFSEIGSSDLPCLLVQRVGRFVAKECTLPFLRVLTLWPDFHTRLMAQQKGMDIPHLSKSEILEPCVPVPGLDEQEKISNRIAAIEARIGAELQSAEKARLLKSGLMDDLLTGRVRVAPLLAQAHATPP